jgi:hypothetical protein
MTHRQIFFLSFRFVASWRTFLSLILYIGSIGASVSLSRANELLLVDGRRLVGELSRILPGGRLEFLANLEPAEFAADQVVLWGRLPELLSPQVVVFADGSLLAVHYVRIENERVHIRGPQILDLVVPVEQLAGVVLRSPGQREQRDRLFDNVLRSTAKQDEVILANGDRIGGLVLRLDEANCLVEIAAGTTQLAREDVVAVIFHPELRAKAVMPTRTDPGGQQSLGCPTIIGLVDGSMIFCREGRSDGPTVAFELLLGSKLLVKTGAVVFLQPLSGEVTYLSDLEPEEFEHRPFLGIERPLGRDRSVLGTRLRKGGQIYPKGLGVQSWARVVYRLDKKFRRFETLVALDDLAEGKGSVEFVVVVDGIERYRSGVVSGKDPARPVSLEVAGADRLELVVEFADRAHQFDFADWLLARLVR